MNYELINNLCGYFGVSGCEEEIRTTLSIIMKDKCDEISTDAFGNLICVRKSGNSLPTVMLDAHMDSVGLVIKKVCENGFLRFEAIGGIDPRILPAAEVLINGKINGVITSEPPHLISDDDKDKAPEIKNMFIDTGNKNIGKIVKAGDRVSFKPKALLMGSCLSGTYLDDRIGCAAIIDVFDRLSKTELPFNLVAHFSCQEELGLNGARLSNVSPELAIVIDVTHGETPDEKSDEVFKTGKGTAIGKGPNVNNDYYNFAISCARNNNIDFQTEVLEGNSGTNAWAYQISGKGIPCLLLSVPLKFMHTPVETVAVKDYDNIVELTECILENLSCQIIKEFSEITQIK